MSHYQPLLTIIGTIAAGIFSLILANKARLPSILFFLTAGILLGPSCANLIQPQVFSTNFPQYISILVALILFEGGMSLKTPQLKEISRPLRGLLTLGVMVTIVLISVFTHFVTQMSWSKSILLGAVMVVTGPTVVIPILHRIRVKENLHNILKWESILIDSIGVILAVVLFEILVSHSGGLGEALLMFIGRFCLGGFLGLSCGFLMVTALRDKKLLLLEGDELGGLFVLSMVLLFFGLSEIILPESGLVSATVAGLYFGNQKFPQKEEISRFKQQITLFALSGLFILLSANVPVGKIKTVYFEGSLLLCFMIFVVRPISVFLSTQGDSRLQFKDKFFLSFMAPRGIVSASLASLFAIQFEERALTGRGVFLPLAFFVITGSIVFYAFFPSFLSRWLRLSEEKGRAVVLVGASDLGRLLAHALRQSDVPVKVIDTSPSLCGQLQADGFEVYCGSGFDRDFLEDIDLKGVSQMAAVTPNPAVNLLCAQAFSEYLQNDKIYRLAPINESKTIKKPEWAESVSAGKTLAFQISEDEKELESFILTHRYQIVRKVLNQPLSFTVNRGGPLEDEVPLFAIQNGHVIFSSSGMSAPAGSELVSLSPTRSISSVSRP